VRLGPVKLGPVKLGPVKLGPVGLWSVGRGIAEFWPAEHWIGELDVAVARWDCGSWGLRLTEHAAHVLATVGQPLGRALGL